MQLAYGLHASGEHDGNRRVGFYGTGITSYTIPSRVTKIGASIFEGAKSLSNLTFEAGISITNIPAKAFKDCTALQAITIPSTVEVIGGYAFNNSGLTSIAVPQGVEEIGDYAFKSATALGTVTLPGSLTTIGTYAFQGCQSLNAITLPSGVTAIELCF